MAVRERKGRASPWQCYWNNPLTGKRECANFATRKEAEKYDSLIKHRLRFERESFQMEEEKESAELTLEACYLQYLKEKQFTRKNMCCHLAGMREILRRYASTPVSSISRATILELLETMRRASVSAATMHKRLGLLRAVLRWSSEQGYCGAIQFPRLPVVHYRQFVPPTPEEIGRILENAAPHIVRVILIGAYLGARVGESEMLRLTWEDVDMERGIVRIHGAKKNPGSPWREVPVRTALMPAFQTWKIHDDHVGATHLIHYRGKPIHSIKTSWRSALKRAGITRHIRPYDLRHAFATELIAGGVDIGTVAKLMGHSNPLMLLKHYQYVMDTQKRAAVEALPDVPKAMCPKKMALTPGRKCLKSWWR